MTVTQIFRIFLFTLISLAPAACLKEKLGENCEDTYYAASIKPLFISRCANNEDCHVSNGTIPPDLTKYNDIFKNKNDIIRRITLDPNDDGFMPKGAAPLSASELQMLNDWIADGAKGCD